MGVTAAIVAGVAISGGQQIIANQQRQKAKGELGAATRKAEADQAKADLALQQKQSAADRQASLAGGIARRRMMGSAGGFRPVLPKITGTPALPIDPVLPGARGAGIGGQPAARKTLIGQ